MNIDGEVKTKIIVRRVNINNNIYLLDDKTNILYDPNNSEEIGIWDKNLGTISITQRILKKEHILLREECVVCYRNFINIKDSNYNLFLKKIKEKYNLTENEVHVFENDTTCLCYDSRFECLTCKNNVCCSCLMNMPDLENGRELDGGAMFSNGYTEVVYRIMDMAYTGIITCPICRIKDKRLYFYGYSDFSYIREKLPEEVLRDIKQVLI